MKVLIEVAATADRLSARVVGRDIAFDEPNRVALVSDKGRDRIVGLGSSTEHVPNARLAPAVSIDTFDPDIAAGADG